eukprot:3159198-Alexandrium_andersonii.AAC.1
MNWPANGAGTGTCATTSVRPLAAKKMGSVCESPSVPGMVTTVQMSPDHASTGPLTPTTAPAPFGCALSSTSAGQASD